MKCMICKINFKNKDEYYLHYKKYWHQYNLMRKIKDLVSIKENNFETKLKKIFNKNNNNDEIKCSNSLKDLKIEGLHFLEPIFLKKLVLEDEIQVKFNPILLKQCFFCSIKFKKNKNVIKHLAINHKFWVPYIEYCSLKKFIFYMKKNIGQKKKCLCLKNFQRIKDLITHMIRKKHFYLTFNKDYYEIGKHYDFLKIEMNEHYTNTICLIKNRISNNPIKFSITFSDIIVLDRSILSHRQKRDNYKYLVNLIKREKKKVNNQSGINFKSNFILSNKHLNNQQNLNFLFEKKRSISIETNGNNHKHFKNTSLYF